MSNRILMLTLFFTTFMMPTSSLANDVNSAKRFEAQLALYEQTLQSRYKEFELVKEVPSEMKASGSMKFEVESEPSGAIATLHNLKTGKPLMSCKTPCSLKGSSKKTYRIVYYKPGYLPSYHSVTPFFAKRTNYPPFKLLSLSEKYAKCEVKMSKWTAKDRPKPISCSKNYSIFPAKAERSGHCNVKYDLDSQGYPTKVDLVSCSEKVFEDNTLTAAVWLRFYPRIENGIAVASQNIPNEFSYILKNGKGKIIPAKK